MFKLSKQRNREEEKGSRQKKKLTKKNNMDWSEYASSHVLKRWVLRF